MKSTSEYKWHGHNIKIHACSSPKFLWLDNKFDILIDNKKVNHLNKRSLTQSLTSFTFHHQGINLKGRVISSGFPCTPVISQSTIVDDTILGHSQMLVDKRYFIYAFISAIAIGLQII